MSGIGHFAAGFAAKPLAPEVPLWVLLAAGETNEILYFAFTALGIEAQADAQIDFERGMSYLTSTVNPWSHGLFMSAVWSILVALAALFVYRNRRTAGLLGMIVFSHWILDFLMHSNLPLFFDSSPLLGIGLESTGPGFMFMTILDLVLLGGGIALYWTNKKRTNRIK